MSIQQLFTTPLRVVNVGIETFKDVCEQYAPPAIQVDWSPPVDVSPAAEACLAKNAAKIDTANQKVMEIILSGTPHLIGLDIARNVIPGMTDDTILHAGPPVTWDRMCGPMRGGVMAGLVYEGRASSIDEAETLAASGTIHYAPCHEHGTVGPMAGIVTPSMPVWILKNEAYGNLAYCTLNEGLGKVLRYGAFGDEVTRRLKWMETTLYPILKAAVAHTGPIDLKNMIAQALHMGDEVHNRNRAGTSLLYRAIAPAILATCEDKDDAIAVLEFINNNDHFFLNLSMPACKATLDAARDIKGSSIALVMARNGTDFGIQLAGTGDVWFTAPADVPDALYFAGFSKDDANPDIGDSAITETGGLGGFAIAAAPAIVQFVGGVAADALRYTHQMYEITAGESRMYQIPSLDFRGTPTGIDVRKVVDRNRVPVIDTGVAHKTAGVGQVGAGLVNAPMAPFAQAYEALAKLLKR
ncbi:MAG: DUF1116 domain-containing protein [Kiritimatiellae bacterium]|jgi:hypothetical protein|nr:DUF1116 domain-containing protein [Kiritimatiellia bacterium]MDY0149414.1 DUF1116 domain-containing protein [Kiritimatiellia bacterium]